MFYLYHYKNIILNKKAKNCYVKYFFYTFAAE